MIFSAFGDASKSNSNTFSRAAARNELAARKFVSPAPPIPSLGRKSRSVRESERIATMTENIQPLFVAPQQAQPVAHLSLI